MIKARKVVMILKDRIKKLRREMDLTQQKFADKLGIKRNTIAKYETGENAPSDAVISLICKTFNVNEAWLREGVGEMFLERTRDEEIANFIGSIQMDDKDSFKKRFISALSKPDEGEWKVLEKMALELMEDREKG